MKRVVSFIISISGINECGARTAGDLCQRKVYGLGADVLLLFLLYMSKMSSGRNWKGGGDGVNANAASSAGTDSICADPIRV